MFASGQPTCHRHRQDRTLLLTVLPLLDLLCHPRLSQRTHTHTTTIKVRNVCSILPCCHFPADCLISIDLVQHAVPYSMMMAPPPTGVPPHPYENGPPPPVQMGGHV